ncbi:MAG: hypothetical protein ACRC5T_10340, partial [Cetobacterium sp.]
HFELWKGQSLKDINKIEGRPVIVTDKLDGYRACIIGDKVFSTEGKEISLSEFPEIERDMKNMPEGYVYDGEMLCSTKGLDRISKYNLTSSLMSTKGTKYGLKFHVFDMIPKEEFDLGKSSLGTYDRKSLLKSVCPVGGMIEYINPLYCGDSVEEVQSLFQESIARGDEGIMIQTYDSKYETCRVSDGIWKLKVRETGDFIVVGFEEGKDTGKNKGTLGNLLVEFKGSTCGVGTGFKTLQSDKYPIDRTRTWIWENQESLIGKIVELDYDENKNAEGLPNLRHASFLRWRFDKETPNY